MPLTPTPKNDTAARKDVQKLQRAIVDGLEDVKAQDIQVFDTEHLSALFERVIIASGTSNRQTKALAASVRDAVRAGNLAMPRTEGEENGEWIIVDCGAAVVHIMQPAIRVYYHLEELWGDTPVRLKLGAAKPVAAAGKTVRKSAASKEAAVPARKPGRAAAAGSPAPATAGGKPATQSKRKTSASSAASPPTAAASRSATPRKRAAPTVSSAKVAGPAVKTPIKKVVIKTTVRPPSRKAAAAAAAVPAQRAPRAEAVRKPARKKT